ncbi:2-succinyl-5-enolpyruvyl-6-hydroxy-3-cyclohexene-1-carboxylic-acid synthase [Vibrio sagamiensis]|uniref:2-succinyl-5-enolpyruvyl-6-hydroxy-3-cyclohexene-1-carboxylate synthase n=1 Tax=Vibrio sagamiensis NBRC 104589 TaxID=1219064 RepID=A0A511QBY9_9VIBR|nr:2-succinyl-5-enolpyruvyl-6-hydroxy-3-cyclohexene-1-carboxylic-acid synthase [Vibrio sagamiensis]PNQ71803.1 2-succinyl-5-enolpyruvyl-6-hydroxy-3-cyclohexene-1-carboxylic-acid synthase [Vibrio agarivorans]GEM74811.1 2-succinyl-5-enolpyruvyl-6-hydroxy-3-cyclohexene-1-carboxylate synthase [Vibrio sagamiensis NBRC 104589]
MKADSVVVNRIWSDTLMTELCRFGVKHICIAPGSRSTPLTLEAAQKTNVTIHRHFDERGLGFLALGLAKASGEPVAVIVTSGTAVANLLPAIAEAKLTGEKLVVLTADRPVELVGCGANQAINQQGIFSHHVSNSLNLPSPTLSISLNWLLTSIDDVMFTQRYSGGAVHINCAYPEPLYSDNDKADFFEYLGSVSHWKQASSTYCKRFEARAVCDIPDFSYKKGLVVIGSLPLEQAQAALEFAQAMGWPVLADPQSGVSSNWAHFDLWLQCSGFAQQLDDCDLVVQFGSRIISKRLTYWIAQHVLYNQNCRDVSYWYVSSRLDRDNPNHLPQSHWVEQPSTWVQRTSHCLSHYSGWADPLALQLQDRLLPLLRQWRCEARQELSEIALAMDLSSRLNNAPNTDLFIGNSLFVRLVDMFGYSNQVEVFTNRGASGIDGVFATANGVQRARQKPLLMFIGDTSALYGLNSLALFSHSDLATVIVITNNDGGAIFSLLPVPEEHRETYYQMPHGYTFESAAKQFGLRYAQPGSMMEYQSMVDAHLAFGQGVLLVEVQTPADQASTQLQTVNTRLHALF